MLERRFTMQLNSGRKTGRIVSSPSRHRRGICFSVSQNRSGKRRRQTRETWSTGGVEKLFSTRTCRICGGPTRRAALAHGLLTRKKRCATSGESAEPASDDRLVRSSLHWLMHVEYVGIGPSAFPTYKSECPGVFFTYGASVGNATYFPQGHSPKVTDRFI